MYSTGEKFVEEIQMPPSVGSRLPNFPYKITWDITHRCNLRCSHCFVIYQNSAITANDPLIRERIATEILRLSPFCLSISGGEPFSVPELPELVAKFIAQDIDVIIATNGALLSEHLIETLQMLKRVSLQISLDGASATVHDGIRGVGSYDATVAVLKRIRQRIPVTVAVTMTRGIHSSIQDFFELAIRLGIPRLKFQKLIISPSVPNKDLSPSVDELAEVADEVRRCALLYSNELVVMHPFEFAGHGNELSIGSCRTKANLGVGLRECTITPDGQLTSCGAVLDTERGHFNVQIVGGRAAWRKLQAATLQCGSSGACLCGS